CLNLLITMALGGLWHGASWHFMVWGIYQGGLLIAQRLWVKGESWVREQRMARFVALDARRGLTPPARICEPLRAGDGNERSRHRVLVGQIVTFHLVCLGWVLFRAETGPLAWTLITFALHPMRHNFTAGFQWFAPGTLGLPS